LAPDGEHDEKAANAAWKRFVRTFVLVFAGGLAVLYALIIAIDPFDSGRFPTFMPPGVSDENQQTANASNGRNPTFSAAVFGNSHGMLLSPQRLDKVTGLRFVQMTSPGSGPREQMLLMRWFMRHHPRIAAFVLAADQTWCTHDPTIPMLYEFPPWLYGESELTYLAHMLNTRSITAAWRRVLVALGTLKPTDPDGYQDYEAGRTWNFKPELAPPRGTLAPILSDAQDRAYPAIRALDHVLAALPADTPVLIILPPQFHDLLPKPGSAAAADLAACKAQLAARIGGREHSGMLDYLTDTPAVHDPANFMDAEHYRANIARAIEADIAALLAGERLRPARLLAN
jgi:hypothetical protein